MYNPDEPLSSTALKKLMDIGYSEVGGYIVLPPDSAIDELRSKGYAQAGQKVLFHKWGPDTSFHPTDELPKIYYRLTAKGIKLFEDKNDLQ